MQWHMPIGYKVIDGTIQIYEEHKKIVKQIFKDYDAGISTNKIAKDLIASNTKNANGRVSWTHASIGKILENHNYLGTEYYPQIIEKEFFERIQRKRKEKRKELQCGEYQPGKNERILFGGMLFCATCGEVYHHVQPSHRSEGYGKAKWKCKNYIYHNQRFCAGGYMTDQQVMEVCVQAINEVIRNKRILLKAEIPPRRYTKRFRELNDLIENGESMDMTSLLYERASESYQGLEVQDTEYRTSEMKQVLECVEELNEFDRELYEKLIDRIIVYKDNTVNVIFQNKSSIKIAY